MKIKQYDDLKNELINENMKINDKEPDEIGLLYTIQCSNDDNWWIDYKPPVNQYSTAKSLLREAKTKYKFVELNFKMFGIWGNGEEVEILIETSLAKFE